MIVTIGIFDGIHIGHQVLLDRVIQLARQIGTSSMILTFPFPAEFFSSAKGFEGLITSSYQKKEQALAYGIDRVEFLDFLKIRHQSPAVFLGNLIREFTIQGMIVGHDFRFGRDRKGRFSLLKRYAQKHGFLAYQVAPVHKAGFLISSSLIRRWIVQGELEKANRFLFRPLTYEAFFRASIDHPYACRLSWQLDEHLAFPPEGLYSVYSRAGGWGIWKHIFQSGIPAGELVFFQRPVIHEARKEAFEVHKKLP